MRRSLILAAVLLVASAVGISADSCAITSVDVHEVDNASNSFVYSPAFTSDNTLYSYTSTVGSTTTAEITATLTTAQPDDTIEVSVNGQEYASLYSGATSSFSGTFNVTGCLNIVALVRGPNCTDRYYQLNCVQGAVASTGGSGFEISSTGSSTPVGTESSTGAETNSTETSTGAMEESSTGAIEESSTAAEGFNTTESSTGATEQSSTAAEGFNTTESSTGAVSTASSTASVSSRCNAILQLGSGITLSPPFQVGVVNYQCRGIVAGGSTVISINGASTPVVTASSTGSAPAAGSTGQASASTGTTTPAASSTAEAFAQSSSSASTPVTTASSTGESNPVTTQSSTGSAPVTTESSTASTPVTTESSTGEAFTVPSSSASTPVTTESSTGGETIVAQPSSTATMPTVTYSSSTGYTYNYPYRRRLMQMSSSYGTTDGSALSGSTAYAYDANGNVYDSNGNVVHTTTTSTSSTGPSAFVDNGSTGQATPVTTTTSTGSTNNGGSSNGATSTTTTTTTTSTGSSNNGSGSNQGTTTTTTESSTAAEAFQVSSTGNGEGGNMFQFGGVWYQFDSNGVGQPITFVQGSNQIVIDVDGCPTFTVTCDTESGSTGAVAPSSTAPEGEVVDETCSLSNLQMANGMKFFPNFSPSVFRYSCSCANTVFLSTITATTFDEMATVTLTTNTGGIVDLLSGVESGSYEMNYGSNKLEIEVQGYTNNVKGCSNTYEFTCYRGGNANDTTIMYNWFTTAYTACSGVCTTNTGTMPGTFNRTVSCHDSNNNVVADSYCSGTKPLSDSNCVTVCATQNRDVIVGGNDSGAGVTWNAASSVQSSYFVALLAAFAAVMASIKF